MEDLSGLVLFLAVIGGVAYIFRGKIREIIARIGD